MALSGHDAGKWYCPFPGGACEQHGYARSAMRLSKTLHRLRSVETPQIACIPQFGARFVNIQVRRMSRTAAQLDRVDSERAQGRAKGAPHVRAADDSR
jgi:hypothetical protein